jgi:feruloyl-CoA synthase
LREVAPLFYSNVPKGYEELIPWLRRDRALRENFFSRVHSEDTPAGCVGLPPPGVTLKLIPTHGSQ